MVCDPAVVAVWPGGMWTVKAVLPLSEKAEKEQVAAVVPLTVKV